MTNAFDDLIEANRTYAASFEHAQLQAPAAKRLAVLTCIDSRIEPLGMLGLKPGDAKILRNAGARVTDDALRSLILAIHLLDVDRVLVVAHTDCAVGDTTDAQLRAHISGAEAIGIDFHAAEDQHQTLAADVS